jgi:two-component system OmpR family response regulator
MRLLLIEDDDILGEKACATSCAAKAIAWTGARAWPTPCRRVASPTTPGCWTGSCPTARGWTGWRERARGDRTPALMLTARDRLSDRLHGLDVGADDYLVKPFAPEELVARLRAVCRRSAPGRRSQRAAAFMGEVEADLAAVPSGARASGWNLTAREWALLEALLLRAGRIVAKADLERLVLGSDAEVASNALEVHVSPACAASSAATLIETVRGLGYRLEVVGP